MNFDMLQNFDETGTYSLTCGDCSWCVVNFDSVGHFAGFICSNHPLHPDVKLTDKCILL
ncbi:hypothetical protein [Microvirus D_HF38_28]|nr:hypothetical protein [Microvirus D_HF38_28]